MPSEPQELSPVESGELVDRLRELSSELSEQLERGQDDEEVRKQLRGLGYIE